MRFHSIFSDSFCAMNLLFSATHYHYIISSAARFASRGKKGKLREKNKLRTFRGEESLKRWKIPNDLVLMTHFYQNYRTQNECNISLPNWQYLTIMVNTIQQHIFFLYKNGHWNENKCNREPFCYLKYSKGIKKKNFIFRHGLRSIWSTWYWNVKCFSLGWRADNSLVEVSETNLNLQQKLVHLTQNWRGCNAIKLKKFSVLIIASILQVMLDYKIFFKCQYIM